MILVKTPITKKQISELSLKSYGNLVKAVVDISKNIMVIDVSMHADAEAYLISLGSKQVDLWGINLYTTLVDDFIEFDSMINIRPLQKNLSRGVDDVLIQNKIKEVVKKLIK